MRLRMIQKPPVVFARYQPEKAISHSDWDFALGQCRNDAIPWLWISYGKTVLSDVDPCMEANEGVVATVALMSKYRSLSQMKVNRIWGKNYELKMGNANLYLSETEEGDVFLYFFSPEKSFNRREECRIDLTDFGSDTAAYFIVTVFKSYPSIVKYFERIKSEN